MKGPAVFCVTAATLLGMACSCWSSAPEASVVLPVDFSYQVPAMVLACREDVEDAEIMYPACGGDRLCAKRSLQDEEAW